MRRKIKAKDLKKRRYEHTKGRLETRYALEVNKRDLERIIKLIQNKKGRFVRRESNSKTHWLLNYQGQELYVVYSKKTKTILTVMPKKRVARAKGNFKKAGAAGEDINGKIKKSKGG